MNGTPSWLQPPEKQVDHLAEMKSLKQWVCCKGNGDKKPIQPNGKAASSTDPTTWHTYEDAKAAKNHGFVLSSSDPFTIIDLDNPEKVPFLKDETAESRNERILEISRAHNDIIDMFNSYTELSMSGNGFHIIVKGDLPVKGFHNSKMCVEAYSSDRWMLFTERPAKNQPIELKQDELNELFNRFGTTPVQVKSEPLLQLVKETTLKPEDQMIIDRAMTAENGAKFYDLYSGNWQAYFKDQSSADASLTSQIEFYTKDREQVNRIFRSSALAQRKKATDRADYVTRTIDFSLQKGAENRPPSVDISALDIAPITPAQAAERATAQPEPVKQAQEPFRLPPGNMGALTRHLLDNAILPVDEISTVAALGAIAGIAGRAWNVSRAGLNIYLILLAGTGRGKEAISTGIDSVMAEFVTEVEGIVLRAGPGAFSSGQAVVKHLSKNPCFVAVWPEFAITLAQITDPRANQSQSQMRKVILDLYGKSGKKKRLGSSVYAESEKNTDEIFSPAFSIVAESQNEIFLSEIKEAHITSGLIPRFLVLQCKAPKGYLNYVEEKEMPNHLHNVIGEMAEIARNIENKKTHIDVGFTDSSFASLEKYGKDMTDRINLKRGIVEEYLSNRAHLNALKIAALLAVIDNPREPVITDEHAEWALWFVEKCVTELIAEYSSGKHAGGYLSMRADVIKIILGYPKSSFKERDGCHISPEIINRNDMVPMSFIRKKAMGRKSFKDSMNPRDMLGKIINDLITDGLLDRVSVVSAKGRNGEVFSPSSNLKEEN